MSKLSTARKMKKITTAIALVLGISGSLSAQQLPLYSQYYFNPFVSNPSMTGISDETNAYLVHRAQWTGIPGAPVTNAFTVDGSIKDKNMGLGFMVFNDVQDINERLGLYASYAYRLKIDDNNRVLLGLSMGFLDNRIDFSKAVVTDNTDPMLFSAIQRKSALDATFGAIYEWKKLRAGFAIPQIFGQHVKYDGLDALAYYQLARHYQGSVQYNFMLSETAELSLEPLAMVRWVPNTPVQYDINAILNWKNIGWLGLSYRSNYAVGTNLRVKLFNSLSAGYAYDVIITPLRTSGGVSHEFMLGYTFGQMQGGGGGKMRGKYD
ncbi:MAG: hypothetical protein FD123_3330 [Bacteroidetes bacterium]|nr:MAG: hypothetical protein FD123_3330 [Bacteroidota bacterium]